MEPQKIDASVSAALTSLSATRNNYWSFDGNAARSYCHNYFHYPAMMVPDMLSDLIRIVTEADSTVKSVYDPFVGSGTVQTEAMLLGLDFGGIDINPLAVLLCRAKSGPFLPERLEEAADDLIDAADEDTSTKREAEFDNLTKWFDAAAIIGLSRIRRAIRTERSLQLRRFFWVALAETVRLSSNSRTSTYKLHIRSESERKTRTVDPIRTFEEIVSRNIESLQELTDRLSSQNLISRGKYIGHIATTLQTTVKARSIKKYDLLVTSPPYGDNATTVPYGQSSFLPLQWIDLFDIDARATREFLRTTHQIDSMSIGGSRKGVLNQLEALKERSPAFSRLLRSLSEGPTDRSTRVAAFTRDLDQCLDPILKSLRKDAYMIWVVGNRRVGGRLIPLDSILGDLLSFRGAVQVATIRRSIPRGSKRMAIKNNISNTMTKESILVYRNATLL